MTPMQRCEKGIELVEKILHKFRSAHNIKIILTRYILGGDMSLLAFCDESFSDKVYAIGGYIAPEKAWKEISEEWKFRLPKSYLDADGRYSFKMMQMMKSEERRSRIPWFYRLIEEKVLLAISVAMSLADIASAKKRIFVDHPDFNINKVVMDDLDDNYVFCCIALLIAVSAQRKNLENIIDPSAQIDFIFDEKSEKKKILKAWDDYMKHLSKNERTQYGARPRFEDDKTYLPLQAADMWAWWVRDAGERSLASGGVEVKVDFARLFIESNKSMAKYHHHITEDSIAAVYQQQARLSIHKDFKIYDLKYGTYI